MDTKLKINLRGRLFEIKQSVLLKYKNSKLAQLSSESDSFCPKDESHYFDISPVLFDYILDAYNSQHVHLPRNVCLGQVCEQLTFWGLDESILAPCCFNRFQKYIAHEKCIQFIRREMKVKEENAVMYFKGRESNWKSRCYRFFEIPNSSRGAKIWSLLIVTMVIASVVLAMVEPLEPCRQFINKDLEQRYRNKNETSLRYMLLHTRPNLPVTLLDLLITMILTVELVMRFVVSPFKKMFFTHKHILNVFDLLGIIPIWLRFIIFIGDAAWDTLTDNSMLRRILFGFGAMKIFRILRLFRIIDHYKPLKLIHLALTASKGEMVLLVILLSLMACIFANVAFISELHIGTFTSPFHALWWAIITMTTVGYGDIYPVGIAGCIVGSICAVMGILVIALPVPVIVNNFSSLYDSSQTLERLAQRHKTQLAVKS